MFLLRLQIHQLQKLMTEHGFNLHEFTSINIESEYHIEHKETGCFFKIQKGQSSNYNFIAYYSPDLSSPNLPKRKGGVSLTNWKETVAFFQRWIPWAKEEIQAPDLWAEAATQIASSNEPFTLAEAEKLQNQLQQLQAEVSTLSLTAAEQSVVKQVLADESKALSALPDRKSWMKAFSTKLSDGLATTLTSPETLAGVAQWIYKALIAAVPTLAAAAAAHHLLN